MIKLPQRNGTVGACSRRPGRGSGGAGGSTHLSLKNILLWIFGVLYPFAWYAGTKYSRQSTHGTGGVIPGSIHLEDERHMVESWIRAGPVPAEVADARAPEYTVNEAELTAAVASGDNNDNGARENLNDLLTDGPRTLTMHLDTSIRTQSSSVQPLSPHVPSDPLVALEFPGPHMCSNLHPTFPVDQFPLPKYNNRDGKVWDAKPNDAFLPWIHDLYVTHDAKYVQVVAQNARRCNTGPNADGLMERLEPQTALLQPVSVARTGELDPDTGEPRFRLSNMKDADPDGKETRFICRFSDGSTTLSMYPFNYEYTHWRKMQHSSPLIDKNSMLKKSGREHENFWLSTLVFNCPIPKRLQGIVAEGSMVGDDDVSRLYLDVVPIRTPVRFGSYHFNQTHVGKVMYNRMKDDGNSGKIFNADDEWGTGHVLPKIGDSGRWSNLPVCRITGPHDDVVAREKAAAAASAVQLKKKKLRDAAASASASAGIKKKTHRLVGCVWTSAGHRTRGSGRSLTDGARRLREWLTFHYMVGFDHFYIYDNSAANKRDYVAEGGRKGDIPSLRSVVEEFPAENVTYIEWPSKICNNDFPGNPNPGERSSQYAAETSCRNRYGPYTEWMSFFDPDEYFIPMGKFNNWGEILDKYEGKGAKVLSMKSAQEFPRVEFFLPYTGIPKACEKDSDLTKKFSYPCMSEPKDKTMLQLYNCNKYPIPKPDWSYRARKQIYKPSYVLSHFVHYSTVTSDMAKYWEEAEKAGIEWTALFKENGKYGLNLDEQLDGILLHAKSVIPREFPEQQQLCHTMQDNCVLGYPWPENKAIISNDTAKLRNKDGFMYTCFINDLVEKVWVPRLEEALKNKAKQSSQQ